MRFQLKLIANNKNNQGNNMLSSIYNKFFGSEEIRPTTFDLTKASVQLDDFTAALDDARGLRLSDVQMNGLKSKINDKLRPIIEQAEAQIARLDNDATSLRQTRSTFPLDLRKGTRNQVRQECEKDLDTIQDQRREIDNFLRDANRFTQNRLTTVAVATNRSFFGSLLNWGVSWFGYQIK